MLPTCIGFDEKSLTDNQRVKISAFIASQKPGDLLELQLYPNLDTTSDENIPTGMRAVFASNAPVDPTIIGDNMFQHMAVSKIIVQPGQTINDEFFKGREADVRDAVEQFPADPVSGKICTQQTNQEIKVWAPELGGPGSFVGIYSKLKDDHRSKDYYIAGRGTVPLFVQDLKRSIAAAASGDKQVTYRDLTTNDKWRSQIHTGDRLAQRNLFRSMANVAEVCGVEIHRTPDLSNAAPSINSNMALPEQAVPEWIQPTHSIELTTFKGQPAVALNYGVVPMEKCLATDDSHFFVVANPYDGIAIFNLTNVSQLMSVNGVPADTGRRMLPEQVSVKETDYTHRIQGIVWEISPKSKSKLVGAAHHVDLHASAFNPVGKEFKHSMRTMGWNPEEHVEKLVCVVAKIYNPELNR